MVKTKRMIANDFERLTFMPMKGINKRSKKELHNVLNFEVVKKKKRSKC